MTKKVTVIVIGAGGRGHGYARFALDFPEKVQIVGVADPRKLYRETLQREHKIENDSTFIDWKEAVEKPKFADCVFICTPDQIHKGPAVAFAKMGYHILLEKPMAVTEQDCEEIVKTCEEHNVMLAVCHVLRYTPQAQKIKEIIDSGRIGDVVNIQLLEPVGYWHFAHSYVRGAWRDTSSSTFSLLAKSCHDIDLLVYWRGKTKCRSISSFGSLKHFTSENKVGYWHFAHSFVRGSWRNASESCFSLLAKSCHDLDLLCYWNSQKKCSQISSFGSLKHFTRSNKPAGAASRCIDCSVEKSCPYSAKKIYLDAVKMGNTGFPVRKIVEVPDIESVTEAIKSGPYGRCVYECDNDVCDNQVVNIQYEDGTTSSFTMIAFTEKVCERQVKVFGTKGEVNCDFSYLRVTEHTFLDGDITVHDLTQAMEESKKSRLRGHGGADFFAVQAFIQAVANNDPSKIMTGPRASLASHKLCFMAEQSRLTNTVVQMSDIQK